VPPLIVFSKAIYKNSTFSPHIFQDHEFAGHGLDESQDKSTDGAGNEISRSGTSEVSFNNVNGGEVQQTSDPFLIKHQNVSIYQAKQSRASCAELLLIGSSSVGVSRRNPFHCQKKPAIKKLLGTKSKRSSKNGKVGIQESSSETDMEIEFKNDDSGDNICYGDAENLYCTGAFLRDKYGEK